MDEDEIDTDVSIAKRHDRWSVLIVGLNGLTQIAGAVTNTLEQYTIMTVQHANQVIYDRKFNEITSHLSQWGK